jgi:hypothetical protein
VNALLETKRGSRTYIDRLRRLAVLPLQSGKFYDTPAGRDPSRLCEWNSRRLRELGVEAVYPDFYFQVGQLIHEAHKCMEHGDKD